MSDKRQPKNSHATALTDKYTLPTSLTAIGITLTALAYIILHSTPLSALGISTVIIAAVTYAIAKGQPKIPPQASDILLQTSIENISALVEEIGLKSKAIYLPASITGDKPKALIPLSQEVKLDKKILPKRLIVKYGTNPEDLGLLVITPGSAVGEMVEAKQDCSAGDIETAVTQVLAGNTGLADGAKASMNNNRLLIEIAGPHLENRSMWIYESIGTPIASIVASIVAQILDKPVTISRETFAKGKNTVDLQVLERKS